MSNDIDLNDVVSQDELVAILKKFNLPEEKFNEWFNGQTGLLLPNLHGQMEVYYFRYDVERFVRNSKTNNKIK